MNVMINSAGLSKQRCFYIKEKNETLEDAIEAHMGMCFESAEEAAKHAPDNVNLYAAWEIVDGNGKIIIESDE